MYLDRLFKLMAEKQASDLFISCGAPINIKVNGVVTPVSTQPMDIETVRRIAYELMTKEQAREFENEHGDEPLPSRPRRRQLPDQHLPPARHDLAGRSATCAATIPRFEQLKLPPVLLDLVMEKRGLVLVAGATGSGKSTTLAAMIDHRNSNRTGHILTIEDPIEYLFEHKQSIVNQREIGVDTLTYNKALQNALREAPDLIMIGEIRDKETMQQALLHTLTGHLCLSTIHANNSYHALSRIINLFPYDARSARAVRPVDRPARDRLRSASSATRTASCSRRSRSCSTPRSSPSSSRTARSRRSRRRWSSRSTRGRRPSSRRCAASTSTARSPTTRR